ncbi:MBL fold metallo-hydrolase [Thalassobacillus hwangdonensis]|uniref:Rhodanese-like domain-containing protein n=1 Tax=Thalassobacillus hwangdonensis TaxID=546108 RepID=A0ABW3L2C6_9BACI
MFFKSFFDENLAQMSYMVGCQRTGEALVVDPARDITPYLETAKKEGFNITATTETHIHADFVSGARELSKRVNAKLYLSDEGDEGWKYKYLDEVDHELVKDGDTFYVGNVKMDVLHTPGHTPESISFVLTDVGGGSDVPMGIFTGDFVFVGDIGRPDLLEKAAGAEGTAQSGAKDMFQALKKFKELPDHLQLWPGHGAGSACGKSLGAVPQSTVGYEKINNWALQMEDESQFVSELIEGQPEPPKYFAMMKKLNKQGPDYLEEKELEKLTVADLKKYKSKEHFIVDTRSAKAFSEGHIPGTINIPFNKSFANWAGWLIGYDQDIILIANEYDVDEIKLALQSIGLDRIVGKVEAKDLAQQSGLETYESVTPEELKEKYKDHDDYVVVDVRNQSEWDEGHMEDANHIMLGTLPDRTDEIPEGKTPVVHCKSGARSAIATSVLQAKGYKDVLNLKGGFDAWAKKDYPIKTS